jgi:FdhE protein
VRPLDGWPARIERAQVLAGRHLPAGDILAFRAQLAAHQQTLARGWTDAEWDPSSGLEALPATLDWLAQHGPSGLVRAVPALRDLSIDDWSLTLERYLAEGPFEAADAPQMFAIETVLQPLADTCARTTAAAHPSHGNRCPFCRQRPATGVLRDAGQGTRRALVCGLCFTEWPFERIVCPSCEERRFAALPVYTAEQVSGVRVDACDSCGVYLKTIDASKDNTVVPDVDDLATVTLDLWAREHGYRRLRPSLYF